MQAKIKILAKGIDYIRRGGTGWIIKIKKGHNHRMSGRQPGSDYSLLKDSAALKFQIIFSATFFEKTRYPQSPHPNEQKNRVAKTTRMITHISSCFIVFISFFYKVID